MKKRVYVAIFPAIFLVALLFPVGAVGGEDSKTETRAETIKRAGRDEVAEPDKVEMRNILILEDDMSAPFYADVAKAYSKYGKYERAIEFYKLAIEKADRSVNIAELYYSLGTSYRYRGKYKEAVHYLEKAVEHAPDIGSGTNYSYSLASAYRSNNQIDKALEAYQFVVNSSKDSVWKESARRQLFYIYQKQNLLEEYITKFEQQIKDEPNNFEANLNLAEIYASVKYNPAKAVPYFEKAHELKPENKEAMGRLAQMYQNTRQYEKALELYKEIAEEAAEDRKAYSYERVSNLYSQLNRREEAVEWIEKILELGKKDTYSYTRVASIYVRFEEYEKAVEMYKQAINAGKELQQKESVLYQLGALYEQMRKYDKAEEVYNTIINNDYGSYYDNIAKKRIEQLKKLSGQNTNDDDAKK